MSHNRVPQFPRGNASGRKDELLATASWHFDLTTFENGMIWLGRNAEGQPVGVADDRHVMTIANNRSGKGTSLIIPNLVQ